MLAGPPKSAKIWGGGGCAYLSALNQANMVTQPENQATWEGLKLWKSDSSYTSSHANSRVTTLWQKPVYRYSVKNEDSY